MLATATVSSTRGPNHKPSLLIVDDENLMARSLSRALSAAFRVQTVNEASGARILLAAQPFDVMLSDYNMPGETGLSLLSWVAARFPSVRRVLMSGNDLAELNQLLADGTLHAFLSKPFDPAVALESLKVNVAHAAVDAMTSACVRLR